jgi:hypothetical protein
MDLTAEKRIAIFNLEKTFDKVNRITFLQMLAVDNLGLLDKIIGAIHDIYKSNTFLRTI